MDTLIGRACCDLGPGLLQNLFFPVMFLIVENSQLKLVTDCRSKRVMSKHW